MNALHRASVVASVLALGCTASDPGDAATDSGTTSSGTTSASSGAAGDGPSSTTAGTTDATTSTTGTDPTGSGTTGDGPPFVECEGDSVAHGVFNAFWSGFDRDYAVFDIRLPDRSWDSVGHELCPSVRADMSEDELFDLLIAMAQPLDDGHVQLEAASINRYDDAWVSEYPYYEELYGLELGVEDNYLDGSLSWAAQDWFAWGAIGAVGYVSITSLDDLSPGGSELGDRAAATSAMAEVMADLSGSAGLIIDIRANEGGWDSVALGVARWFAGAQTLAWSERYRNGPEHDDFSEWEDVNVDAAVANAFTGPVVLLTSGGSFSAAETFALAMRVRDNVTIVGERSSGHFSDLIDGDLPNGWSYSLSGERYRAADGMIYEAAGVPVDTAVDLNVAALGAGQDVMLEAALTQLGQ